jgi:carbon-monoxide dehydrogenase medium subunit
VKNPPFNYHRPATLDEALDLLAIYGDEAKVLAGGQSLLPVMALRLGRPEHVVDIGAVAGLDAITVGNGGVTIGAMVRQAQAEKSADVAHHAPLVSAALPHVGHRAIRNRGTVVGSIAHADAAAEMPAVCLATDATMHIASSNGTRQVDAADFFQGYFTTSIEPNEILTAVQFPQWSPTAGGTVVEVSRRHGDYAMVGLSAMVDVPDGTITNAALSFFAVAGTPVRVGEAEAALIGKQPTEEAFAEAATIVANTLEPSGDIHATAAYRRHISAVLTRKGLSQATSRIGVSA